MQHRILAIEDDTRLARMLTEYLAGFGFALESHATAAAGLQALARGEYEALLLDVMLPDADGFDVCRQVRGRSDLPILMLTARGEETDRIVGLELGADDYLPKPFNPRELLARLRAILRRRGTGAASSADVLRFGRLEVDRARREARVDGESRALTGHQFDLLLALAENAGRVLSREQLMDKLRGDRLEPFDRSIDVHVSRIRAAVEDDPRHPRRILTLRGAGYLFAAEQD